MTLPSARFRAIVQGSQPTLAEIAGMSPGQYKVVREPLVRKWEEERILKKWAPIVDQISSHRCGRPHHESIPEARREGEANAFNIIARLFDGSLTLDEVLKGE